MAITKRLAKGSALTHTELDGNFTDLDGRVTTLESASDSDSQTLTLAGDNLTIIVDLISPIACSVGLRFAIREGGRTVGAGVVAEIIE